MAKTKSPSLGFASAAVADPQADWAHHLIGTDLMSMLDDFDDFDTTTTIRTSSSSSSSSSSAPSFLDGALSATAVPWTAPEVPAVASTASATAKVAALRVATAESEGPGGRGARGGRGGGGSAQVASAAPGVAQPGSRGRTVEGAPKRPPKTKEEEAPQRPKKAKEKKAAVAKAERIEVTEEEGARQDKDRAEDDEDESMLATVSAEEAAREEAMEKKRQKKREIRKQRKARVRELRQKEAAERLDNVRVEAQEDSRAADGVQVTSTQKSGAGEGSSQDSSAQGSSPVAGVHVKKKQKNHAAESNCQDSPSKSTKSTKGAKTAKTAKMTTSIPTCDDDYISDDETGSREFHQAQSLKLGQVTGRGTLQNRTTVYVKGLPFEFDNSMMLRWLMHHENSDFVSLVWPKKGPMDSDCYVGAYIHFSDHNSASRFVWQRPDDRLAECAGCQCDVFWADDCRQDYQALLGWAAERARNVPLVRSEKHDWTQLETKPVYDSMEWIEFEEKAQLAPQEPTTLVVKGLPGTVDNVYMKKWLETFERTTGARANFVATKTNFKMSDGCQVMASINFETHDGARAFKHQTQKELKRHCGKCQEFSSLCLLRWSQAHTQGLEAQKRSFAEWVGSAPIYRESEDKDWEVVPKPSEKRPARRGGRGAHWKLLARAKKR